MEELRRQGKHGQIYNKDSSEPIGESRDNDTFSLKRFIEAYDVVRGAAARKLFKRTPVIEHWKDFGDMSCVTSECDVYLKLENTQVTGSYKVRGVLYQTHQFVQRLQQSGGSDVTDDSANQCRTGIGLVTMSAGNYGKAFACITAALAKTRETNDSEELDGGKESTLIGRRVVVLPTTAPANRQTVIESLGAEVLRVPTTDLVATVNDIVKDGTFHFMQPINDDDVILGHGSLGLEILEDIPDPDVVVVPCGGGNLLAAVAATIKMSLQNVKNCRIYGIEPDGANTMWQSLKADGPASMPTAHSIASGLAPPYAGESAYRLCRQYVDDIILVPDVLIARAVTQLYNQGFVVEPSAAVGYAALTEGLIPGVTGCKVVLLLTGGNITPDDMSEIFQMART